jgi:cytochrome c biogenesis protein CcdA
MAEMADWRNGGMQKWRRAKPAGHSDIHHSPFRFRIPPFPHSTFLHSAIHHSAIHHSPIPLMPVPLDQALRDHPLLAIPALFGAGLVTSLTPCVYPMIPITAGLLGGAGAAGRSRSRTMLYSVLYALGLSLVYASLGLLAGLTGSIFGTVSSNPWAYFIMGNLLLVFGLAMLDVFSVTAPSSLLQWASNLTSRSAGGAFLMGATSGLVAAPCGAPGLRRGSDLRSRNP